MPVGVYQIIVARELVLREELVRGMYVAEYGDWYVLWSGRYTAQDMCIFHIIIYSHWQHSM